MLSKQKNVIHLPANQSIDKSKNTSSGCLRADQCGDLEVDLIDGAVAASEQAWWLCG